MSVEERQCDTCFTQEYLGQYPAFLMRVTRDSIERQQRKEHYTKDDDGVPVCMECGFTVLAHRREPPAHVAAPAAAAPVAARMIETIDDVRSTAGMPGMPYGDAVIILHEFIGRLRVGSRPARDVIVRAHGLLALRPHTATRMSFTEEAKISLNGEISKGNPDIVAGMCLEDGAPRVVKFIIRPPIKQPQPPRGDPSELQLRLYSAYWETQVARLSPSIASLVPCTVFKAEENIVPVETQPTAAAAAATAATAAEGTSALPSHADAKDGARSPKTAIVMPHYPRTAAHYSPMPHDVLARLIAPIGEALTFLHGKGFVHMDVKPSNIFIDSAGAWRLGDFGSACPVGDRIHATTNGFHIDSTRLDEPATPAHDWGMLLCTLAVLMSRVEGDGPTVRIPYNVHVGLGRGHLSGEGRTAILAGATGPLRDLVARWTALAGGK